MITKILATLGTLMLAVPALAQEHVVEAGHGGGMVAIAAAIGLGIAGLGGALGQGKAAAAALEGIARNPAASTKLLVPLILSLAFIEALSIYALVIAFQLVAKV